MLVEPLLQKDGGGCAVHAAGHVPGGHAALGKPSLGLDRAQSLVEQLHLELGRVSKALAESNGALGGNASLAAHHQWKSHQKSADALTFGQSGQFLDEPLVVAAIERWAGMRKHAELVRDRQSDANLA